MDLLNRETTIQEGKVSRHNRPMLKWGLGLSGLVLLLCWVMSLKVGSVNISAEALYRSLVAFDGSTEHLIIRTIRLPRSLIAMSVGAALAVAGAMAQGLTRNPLAEPGILGINAGAALAVVAAIFWLDSASTSVYTACGFLGAGIAAMIVYVLGSAGMGGLTPLKLTVAGAALQALLVSLTTSILILNQRTLDEVRLWMVGSVAGRDLNLFLQIFPFIFVGLVVAFALGKPLTTLTLGEDVAIGLGQRTAWVKAGALICVVLLAGASVAVAGPIAFVGLVVPHIVRFLIGVDYRWILPYSAIFGGILLLLADIVARLVLQPKEMPVGVMTVLLGAPFFIYLALWKVKR